MVDSADLSERFGGAVRRLREQHGWSQEQLAWRAEVNRSYLGEVERAAVMPSLAVAAKLAGALEVALSRLIADCESDDVQGGGPARATTGKATGGASCSGVAATRGLVPRP